ncbi:MAG: polysaccharide biosynthesis tyrosine autokinase [bacterium]
MASQINSEYVERSFPEEENQTPLRDCWHVIVKYRWSIITVFLVTIVTVGIITYRTTPIYKVTTQIQIDKDSPNVVRIDEVISSDAKWDWNYYQTQYKILQSRTLAKTVIDNLNLSQCAAFTGNKDKGKTEFAQTRNVLLCKIKDSFKVITENSPFRYFLNPSQSVTAITVTEADLQAKKDNELIDTLLSKLKIEPLQGSNLVNISFLHPDPFLAAAITNSLAEQYIQSNLQHKYEAAMDATNWLSQHVGELKKKLEASEEALFSYTEQNKIVSLEEKQNISIQKLSELNTAVTEANTKRIRLETLYNQIKGSLDQNPEQDLAQGENQDQNQGQGLSQEQNQNQGQGQGQGCNQEQDLAQGENNEKIIKSLPANICTPLMQKLKTDYAALLVEYSRESSLYGSDHPKIVAINSQLETTKKSLLAEANGIINGIKTEYEIALAQENGLLEALEEQKKEAMDLNKKSIQYNVLKRNADSDKGMFEMVLNRLKETDLTTALKTCNVRIVDKAHPPKNPVLPNKKKNLIVASILGLLMGLGLAFLQNNLDNTIKTPDDLKRYLDTPFLGPVPHADLSSMKDFETPELITLHKPKSSISEAYKGLRTSIMFSFSDAGSKTLLITSAIPGEGKTITSVNLALTMAQVGAKVVIIDADMRKPRLHQVLKVKNDKGLSSLLVGRCQIEEVIQKGPVQNLMVITSGHRPPNPSELLVSPHLEKILNDLKSRYDMIIIDSPPIVAVTDSVIISRLVDGIALVIHGGATNRDIIKQGRNLLQKANAHLLGAVINNIDLAKRSYYYNYKYYSYQYYSGDEGEQSKRRKRTEYASVD